MSYCALPRNIYVLRPQIWISEIEYLLHTYDVLVCSGLTKAEKSGYKWAIVVTVARKLKLLLRALTMFEYQLELVSLSARNCEIGKDSLRSNKIWRMNLLPLLSPPKQNKPTLLTRP